MTDAQDDTPQDESAAEGMLEDFASREPSPDRRMFMLFAIVVGVSFCGVLWLAVRSSTPEAVRDSMDFILQAGMGALLAYAGFRSLVIYPFRFFDLLGIVILLSLFMKIAVETIEGIAASGFFEFSESSARLGVTVQVCCIAASVLLAGAALGLRHCTLLKIQNTPARMLTVLSGMLVLPAAAGFFVFPVLVLRDALSPEGTSQDTGAFLFAWLVSVIANVVNATCMIKTMALTHEIEAREKMP